MRGREAITQRLMAMTDYHSALGGGGHNVDSIHTQKAQVWFNCCHKLAIPWGVGGLCSHVAGVNVQTVSSGHHERVSVECF